MLVCERLKLSEVEIRGSEQEEGGREMMEGCGFDVDGVQREKHSEVK